MDREALEDVRSHAFTLVAYGEKDVFCTDAFVPKRPGFTACEFENLLRPPRKGNPPGSGRIDRAEDAFHLLARLLEG